MSGKPSKVVPALEGCDESGRGVRVEFVRLEDRYAHRVLAIGCEELPVLLLESVEGAPGEVWPANPALQALNIDDLTPAKDACSHNVAMLVGMSGKTHWSLSVEAFGDGDRPPLESTAYYAHAAFKAACRIKDQPPSVGSRYSIGPRIHVEPTTTGLRLHFGSGICVLDSIAAPIAKVSEWRFDSKRHQAWIAPPAVDVKKSPPATIQWQYRVALFGL